MAHVQLLAKNMAAKYVHAFAYAINKTSYVILYWFSVKITLCIYVYTLWQYIVVYPG